MIPAKSPAQLEYVWKIAPPYVHREQRVPPFFHPVPMFVFYLTTTSDDFHLWWIRFLDKHIMHQQRQGTKQAGKTLELGEGKKRSYNQLKRTLQPWPHVMHVAAANLDISVITSCSVQSQKLPERKCLCLKTQAAEYPQSSFAGIVGTAVGSFAWWLDRLASVSPTFSKGKGVGSNQVVLPFASPSSKKKTGARRLKQWLQTPEWMFQTTGQERDTGTHCFWAWSIRFLRVVICKQHTRLGFLKRSRFPWQREVFTW